MDINKAMGLGIALGVALGIVMGMLLFDNPALGIGVGIALGVGVGGAFFAAKDEKRGKPGQGS
jgi:hypothetical protein